MLHLDRFELLTYDEEGSWNLVSWFNSPLYTQNGLYEWSVQTLVQAAGACGIPPAKTSIGIPFYGVKGSPNTGPYQSPGDSPTFTPHYYYQIAEYYPISLATFDSLGHEPWLNLGSSWLNWDNAEAVTDKVNFVKANGLGGWVIWALGYDYIPSATPTNPLLDAVKKAFRPVPPTDLKATVK